MKSMKTEVYFEPAVNIIAYLSDYAHDVDRWKHDFYELWRWQMGYSFAHKIEVNESRERGVYLSLLVKPEYKKAVMGKLEEYGYGISIMSDEHVAHVDTCYFPEDCFEVVAD